MLQDVLKIFDVVLQMSWLLLAVPIVLILLGKITLRDLRDGNWWGRPRKSQRTDVEEETGKKSRLIAPLVILVGCWSADANATNATTLLCGSDPAILTPFHPIRTGVSGSGLQAEPDVTLTFEGTRPCSGNRCRIAIRHGDSGELIAAVRLPSDSVTYCRDRRPFFEWPVTDHAKTSEQCQGGFYASSRMIVFGKEVDDVDALYAEGSPSIGSREGDPRDHRPLIVPPPSLEPRMGIQAFCALSPRNPECWGSPIGREVK